METINSVIMVVSIIICLILTAYFIRWSAWKRIKPGYVQRNVLTFSWIQALILTVALLLNGIALDFQGGGFNGYYALIPIVVSVVLGIICREVLVKNYQEHVVEGKKCFFVVANVFDDELHGYVILDGNWLPGKTMIAHGTSENYEENQQMAAVVCSGKPDGEFVVVRI